MAKKRMLVLLVLAVALLGCIDLSSIFGKPSDLELVPGTSSGVVIIKVADLLNDKNISSMYQQSTGQSIAQAIAKGEANSGMDITQFSKAVVFYKSGSSLPLYGMMGDENVGVILKGTFDKNKIIGSLKQNQTVTESDYQGYTIYGANTAKAGESALTFIDDGTIVMGTMQAVKDAIDVKKGNLDSIKSNANVTKLSGNLNMDSLIVFLVHMPQGSAANYPSGGAIDTEALSSVEWAGMSLDKQGESINMKYALLAQDAASAGKVSDALDGTIKLAKGYSKSGSKTEALLNKIQFNVNGDIVTMGLSTTVTELKDVWNELENSSNAASPTSPSGTYSYGVTPSRCTFPAGFTCIAYKLYTDGALYLSIGQGTGRTINVRGVKCTMDTSYLTSNPSGVIDYPVADTAVQIESGTIGVVADPESADIAVVCTDENSMPLTGTLGDTYNGYIYVNYTEADTGITRIARGSISTKYET